MASKGHDSTLDPISDMNNYIKMASASITDDNLKCKICFEWFNSDERLPRMVSCGHTFCHSCLDNMMRRARTCGICRQPIRSYVVDEVPVNYAIKELAEAAQKSSTDDICEDHNSLMNWECETCKVMMCGTCGLLNHRNCQINFVISTLKQKKDLLANKTTDMDKLLTATTSNLEKYSQFLKHKAEKLSQKIKQVKAILVSKEEEVLKCQKVCKAIQLYRNSLNKIEQEIVECKDTTFLSNVNNSFEENKNKLDALYLNLEKMTTGSPFRQLREMVLPSGILRVENKAATTSFSMNDLPDEVIPLFEDLSPTVASRPRMVPHVSGSSLNMREVEEDNDSSIDHLTGAEEHISVSNVPRIIQSLHEISGPRNRVRIIRPGSSHDADLLL